MNKMLAWAKGNDNNIQRLIDIVTDDDNMGGGYEDQMEEIFVEVYGERVTCPDCGSGVLPTYLCWGCEEWTAPEEISSPPKWLYPTLKDWSWDGTSMCGEAWYHPNSDRFPNGKRIRTSNVLDIYRIAGLLYAKCKSRVYLLDGIDQGYEKEYPGAEKRLIDTWAKKKKI